MIYEPLSYWQFKDKRWRLPQTVAHAKDRPTITMARSDLRSVARISPIGFTKLPDGWHPVLLNDPAYNAVEVFEDRWLNHKLPIFPALYPFTVVWQDRNKQWVLGIARDPEVVGDDGEPFFTEEGPLTARLNVAYRMLCIAQAGYRRLNEAANRLAEHGLFEPIPVAGKLRRAFSAICVDRLECLIDQQIAQIDVELAYAAAFSLRNVPPSILDSLGGYRASPTMAAFKRQEDPALVPTAVSEPSTKDESLTSFLHDDDEMITFNFSARRGVFSSG